MSQINTLICNKCFTPIYRGKRPFHITQCGHISCQTCLQQGKLSEKFRVTIYFSTVLFTLDSRFTVEKQCPQCQRVGSMSLALEEPLSPKLSPFFQPISETLEMLLKIDMFRTNQMKIIMQRFYELVRKINLCLTVLPVLISYIYFLCFYYFSRLYYVFVFFFAVDARSKDKKYEMLKTRYWLEQRNLKVLMEKYVSAKNKKEKLEKKLLLSEMQRGTPRSAYRVMETPISDSGVSSLQSSTG